MTVAIPVYQHPPLWEVFSATVWLLAVRQAATVARLVRRGGHGA